MFTEADIDDNTQDPVLRIKNHYIILPFVLHFTHKGKTIEVQLAQAPKLKIRFTSTLEAYTHTLRLLGALKNFHEGDYNENDE